MIRPFKDQPIVRKAVILGLVPTMSALIIASAAFLVSTYVSLHGSLANDLDTAAAMTADSIDFALGLNDAATVRQLVGALREKHGIDRACVFDANGRFVAGYATKGNACPAALDPTPSVRATQLVVTRRVMVGNRPIGTVRIAGNLDALFTTLGAQALITLLVLTGATGIALLLISRLQRAVVQPVTDLAMTADRVSRSRDYGLRAARITNDEVGQLVQSFNGMLETIERAEGERSALLEREREASRLKDEFLAAVSHELRTPLNAILGWTHILSSTPPSPETLDRGLKALHRNARAQTRLIEDLIEVSRIATGKLNLKIDMVDLREVVRQAVDAVQTAALARALTIDVSAPAAPALVSGDRDRLLQIVANLVNNAVKFTGPGGAVTVSLAPAGSEFVLRVRDTGIGIAPEFLPHVFERFRQADGSTTREHGGLGLGLAIVSELVQLHHGSVKAESSGRGLGAEFVVRLPQLVDEAAVAPRAPQDRDPVVRLSGVRILAVDDNADALEVIAAALSASGAQISVAGTGDEALRQWAEAPADVLVCDLGMPGTDGFEVIRRVRALDTTQGRHTFAVALTAYASADYVTRALEAGFDAHAAKPLDPARVISLIASGMSVSRPAQS